MINKHMSILIGSMLVTSAAQAQEQTDTSTWKYVNDNASPSVIDYKQGNYHKSGKPKKFFLILVVALIQRCWVNFMG